MPRSHRFSATRWRLAGWKHCGLRAANCAIPLRPCASTSAIRRQSILACRMSVRQQRLCACRPVCEAQRFGMCQLYISGYGCCSHVYMLFTGCAATCSVTHVQLHRSAPMGAMGPAAKTGQLPRTHSLAAYSRKTPATHTGPRAHPPRTPRCLFVPGLIPNLLFTLHMRCCLVTCTDAGH